MTMRRVGFVFAVGLITTLVAAPWASAQGQAPSEGRGQGGGRGGAGGGRGFGGPPPNLPQTPTAVVLPSVSALVTGPGQMYDSTPSLAPGKGLAAFKYEAKEYFISRTANGPPY